MVLEGDMTSEVCETALWRSAVDVEWRLTRVIEQLCSDSPDGDAADTQYCVRRCMYRLHLW